MLVLLSEKDKMVPAEMGRDIFEASSGTGPMDSNSHKNGGRLAVIRVAEYMGEKGTGDRDG